MDTARLQTRTLRDLELSAESAGLEDPYGIYEPPSRKRAALKANPAATGTDVACQTLGLVGNKVVGQHTIFPVRLRAFGAEYEAWTGSGLYLHDDYRKTGLGIQLIEGENRDGNTIHLGCGLSRLSVPLHLLLDYACFPMKRMLWLAKSGPVVCKFLRNRFVAAVAAFLCDLLLQLPNTLLRLLVSIQSRHLRIERLDRATAAVAEMAAADTRPCACVHSEAWFNWILNHTFADDPRSRQRLFLVRDRRDRPLGFFLYKIRFHATASHRGFKDLLLGSLLEWQSVDEHRLSHGHLARLAARELLREGVDAIEVCTDEKPLLKSLHRWGFRPLGDFWFVVRARENHPLHDNAQFLEQEYWRLRPVEGDTGLS